MNKLLFAGFVALVSFALVAGFYVVGGPGHARMEKRDRQRLADLRRFGEFKTCELTPSSQPKDCAGLKGSENPVDPHTGEAFTFEARGEDAFRVCATFEINPARLPRYQTAQVSIEGKNACYSYQRNAANGEWMRR